MPIGFAYCVNSIAQTVSKSEDKAAEKNLVSAYNFAKVDLMRATSLQISDLLI